MMDANPFSGTDRRAPRARRIRTGSKSFHLYHLLVLLAIVPLAAAGLLELTTGVPANETASTTGVVAWSQWQGTGRYGHCDYEVAYDTDAGGSHQITASSGWPCPSIMADVPVRYDPSHPADATVPVANLGSPWPLALGLTGVLLMFGALSFIRVRRRARRRLL